MEQTKIGTLRGLVVLAAFLLLLPSSTEAQVHKLTCGPQKTIGEFLKILQPGATLLVSGTCVENVDIPGDLGGSGETDRLILDGQGTATNPGAKIIGQDPDKPTINIRVRGVTVRGFEITGGKEGIHLQSATATIDNNSIHNTGASGIGVHGRSFAVIVNNIIEANGQDPNKGNRNGIDVFEDSYARIGVRGDSDTNGSPNTIRNNKGSGVLVTRSSSAWIVGNEISNNDFDGVGVFSVSHAQISSNTINANVRHGVNVGENSGTNLGRDGGNSIFDMPNTTTPTQKNVSFGIRCVINSSVNGRHEFLTLGNPTVPTLPSNPFSDPLNGIAGKKTISTGCVDSLDNLP